MTKLLLAILNIVILFTSGCLTTQKEIDEKIQLENKIQTLEENLNILSKKLDKITIVNNAYNKHLAQIDSSNIIDVNNTEISINGVIKITPNINKDYNLAVLAIKYNNIDDALTILQKIKQNLKSAIANEIDLQQNISRQIYSQGDNDARQSSLYLENTTRDKTLSGKATNSNFKPINDDLNSKSISPLSKSPNKDLVFDIDRLKFFYRAIFEVNYLIGYIHYAKKDFKNAALLFLENNNISDENAKFIEQNQFLINVFALAYSFVKINRNDKYCELITITKIKDKRTFYDSTLYENISASLPNVSCSKTN